VLHYFTASLLPCFASNPSTGARSVVLLYPLAPSFLPSPAFLAPEPEALVEGPAVVPERVLVAGPQRRLAGQGGCCSWEGKVAVERGRGAGTDDWILLQIRAEKGVGPRISRLGMNIKDGRGNTLLKSVKFD
jgi:hypothetical protein